MKTWLPLICILFISCVQNPEPNLGEQLAYVPIYADATVLNDIKMAATKPTVNAGKIYAYGNYLFQVEQFEGIHIINNTDPEKAYKIGFLKVPTCTEIAIKSSHLYTNNLNDLVVFNLADAAAPQLVKRVKNAFPQVNQLYPPVSNTLFECVDPTKGIVVRWEQKTIKTPACRR